MAMQNQASMLLMGSSHSQPTLSQDGSSQDTLIQGISSQDVSSKMDVEQNPCPHHESTINGLSSLSNECPECTNCKCNIVSSVGSLLLPSGQPDHPNRNTSQGTVFIASAFPDSPNTSILRPPIA